MEGDGKSYEIKKYGKVRRKSFVYIKLTETAERALNEFIQNKLHKRKKITIQFDGTNRIVIPKKAESCTLTFDLTDCFDLNGAQGEMSLCSQMPGLPFSFHGFFKHRLKVHAKYESFQQASEKLRIIENNQRMVKQLDTLPTARKCVLAKRKLSLPDTNAFTKELNRRSVPSVANKPPRVDAIKKAANQPLNKSGETLFKRFIHLLALKPLKKMDILKKISLSEVRSFSERARYFSILKDISFIEMDTYNLRYDIWKEVSLDWPHYTESERETVKKNMNEINGKKLETTQLSSQSLKDDGDAMPGENSDCNRPGYYRTSDGLETKRRRIARVPPPVTDVPEVKEVKEKSVNDSGNLSKKSEVKRKSLGHSGTLSKKTEVKEKSADQFSNSLKKTEVKKKSLNHSGNLSKKTEVKEKSADHSGNLTKKTEVKEKITDHSGNLSKRIGKFGIPSENNNLGLNSSRNNDKNETNTDSEKMILRQRSIDSIAKIGSRNLRSDFNANNPNEITSRATDSDARNAIPKAFVATKNTVDSLVSDLDENDCALLFERLSKRLTAKGVITHNSPKIAICPTTTEYTTPPTKCLPFRLDSTPENNFASGKYDFDSPKATPTSFPDMSPICPIGSLREKERKTISGENTVGPDVESANFGATTTRRSLRSNLMLGNNSTKNEIAKSASENFQILDVIAAYCSKNKANSELLKEIGENPIIKMGNVKENVFSQQNADPEIVAARLKNILGDWKGCAKKSCMDLTLCQMLSMGTKRLDTIRQMQQVIDSYKPIAKVRQRKAYKAEFDKQNKRYSKLVANVKDDFEKLNKLNADQMTNDPHSDYIETVLLMVKLSHIKHLIYDYDNKQK